MGKREVRLELLLGKQVISRNGTAIGRIQEVQGELRRGDCLIKEFRVGDYALFDRLAAWRIGAPLLRIFGISRRPGYRISWEKIDLSNPDQPHLNCNVNELEPLKTHSER
ncbi:MAG: hypothetical protein ABR555_17755 [Pyrinomonadaceae bacterium]